MSDNPPMPPRALYRLRGPGSCRGLCGCRIDGLGSRLAGRWRWRRGGGIGRVCSGMRGAGGREAARRGGALGLGSLGWCRCSRGGGRKVRREKEEGERLLLLADLAYRAGSSCIAAEGIERGFCDLVLDRCLLSVCDQSSLYARTPLPAIPQYTNSHRRRRKRRRAAPSPQWAFITAVELEEAATGSQIFL